MIERDDEEASSLSSSSSESTSSNIRSQIEKHIRDQDGQNALYLVKKTLSSNLGVTLKFLNSLMQLLPKQTTDFAVSSYPSIQPWNVEKAIQASLPRLYGYYLTQLLSTQIDRRQDRNLVETWMEHMLSEWRDENSEESHGNSEKIRLVKDAIVNENDGYKYDINHVIGLCKNYGYLPGLIDLHLKLGQMTQVIDLILDLDDLDSFRRLMKDDSNDWKYALEKIEHKIRGSFEENSEGQRLISNDVIMNQMLEKIGTRKSLELLQELPLFLMTISPSIYREFIRKGKIEESLANISRQLLENLDSYLWSKKPPTIPPQIRLMIEEEKQMKKEKKEDHVTQMEELEKLPFVEKRAGNYDLSFDYTVPLPRFYEDR